MSTHTPGPWKVAQITHNSQLKSHERRGYAGSIAYVYTDRPYPQGICVASVREELLGEVEANAQLIAAAPEMHAMLDMVREAIEMQAADMAYRCGLGVSEWEAFIDRVKLYKEYQQIKAVLAKAKGGYTT